MVSADPASFQSAASLQTTPRREKSAELADNGRAASDKSNAAGLRRPRNREITSRYKSPTTSVSPAPTSSRRFPSPNVDRITAVPDVASPKRAQSAERRRPSPTRTSETKVSNGSVDAAIVPKRAAGRAELLWPSTRSMSSSMQGEAYSPPSNGQQAKSRLDSRGKTSSLASDHTLKPSANVVQRPAEQRKGTPERKGTPLRRQNIDQAENARPLENVHSKSEQHRWPGTSNGKMSGAAMSRSVDLTADRERPLSRAASLLVQGKPGSGASRAPPRPATSRVLSQSINEGLTLPSGTRRTQAVSRGRRRDSPVITRKGSSKDTTQSSSLQQADSCTGQDVHPMRQSAQAVELACVDAATFTDNASDTDSVSSGGTTATYLSRGASANGTANGTGSRVVRGTTVPARFWQDAASRSRRLSESNRLRSSMPEPDLSTVAAAGKSSNRHKVAASSEIQPGSNVAPPGLVTPSPWSGPPNRSMSAFSPPQQPPSPVKTSPYRSLPSPTRSRGPPLPLPPSSLQSNRSSSAAAMFSFGIDARKGKKGLSQVEEAHLHRILQNRLLQWRFVNARAEAAMNAQRFAAEKLLYSVCARIFELRASVTTKRIRLQQARQVHKLNSLLSAQAPKLEDWSSVQQEHSTALTGAVQALEAAILQVPVTGGVKADTLAVKEAIGSAFDVMNSVESSVTYLLPKAEKTNCLVSELANVAAQERVLLEECGDLLVIVSALEVEERSMRTHLVQLEQEKARVLGHFMDSSVAASDSVLLSSP